MAAFLPPIEKPQGLLLKMVYFFTRRQFGKVATPIAVFSARMPAGFLSFYGKVSRLDKKLKLSSQTAVLIREQVASINSCLFCMDASRWYATKESPNNAARFDALPEYLTNPLFTDAERAALDYVTELTTAKEVHPDTFARLARYYSEREICDIVWLVGSEHLYNMSNIGLNIGSDGLCEVSPQRATGSSTSPPLASEREAPAARPVDTSATRAQ
jgi:alkylhydroperoxidase family enzyme